jgi:hypothetical protein
MENRFSFIPNTCEDGSPDPSDCQFSCIGRLQKAVLTDGSGADES